MKKSSNRQKQLAVGYGKPPIHTQFRKGESGNPKGRPKVRKRIGTIFADQLRRRITVSENGKSYTIDRQEAFIIQTLNKAIKGDARASRDLIYMLKEFGFFDMPAVRKTLVIRAKIPPPPYLRTAEQQKQYDATRWQSSTDTDDSE
jgi:hypothetical protein